MNCRNYYKMPKTELLSWLYRIRIWLSNVPNSDPNLPTVLFALDVACDAKDLIRDQFTNEVIDNLT